MLLQPKISIIVSVYNIDKYIRDCIESLISQTYHNLEIIIIDDGSNDKSLEISLEYKKLDNRIIIVNQINQGLSSTRNKGIEIATGDFIYFMDGDDFISPKFIEKMMDTIIFTKAQVVHNPNFILYYSENSPNNKKINIHQNNSYETNNITHSTWSKIFNLGFLKNTGILFTIGRLYEDYEFWNKFMSHINKPDISFYNGNECYYYRQRPNSIIDKAKNNQVYDNHILKCIESIYQYYLLKKETLNFKPLYISLVNDHLAYLEKKHQLKFILETRKLFKKFESNFIDSIIMPSCKKTYIKFTNTNLLTLILKSLFRKKSS